jgi:hypothetical protein
LLDKTEYLEERIEHHLEDLKYRSSSSTKSLRRPSQKLEHGHEVVRSKKWETHDPRFEGHYGLGNEHDRHSHQSDYTLHDVDEDREDVGYNDTNDDVVNGAENHIRCDTHLNPPDQPFPVSIHWCFLIQQYGSSRGAANVDVLAGC